MKEIEAGEQFAEDGLYLEGIVDVSVLGLDVAASGFDLSVEHGGGQLPRRHKPDLFLVEVGAPENCLVDVSHAGVNISDRRYTRSAKYPG